LSCRGKTWLRKSCRGKSRQFLFHLPAKIKGERMQKGLGIDPAIARETSRWTVMSEAEEKQLFSALEASRNAGDEAEAKRLLGELVSRNMRFLIHSAGQQSRRLDLPFDDLLNECVIGMLKAAETFEIQRGKRFLSYSGPWIKAAHAKLPKARPHVDVRDCEWLVASDDTTEEAARHEEAARLRGYLAQLDRREKIVICWLYGIGCDRLNLRQIALQLRMTKQAVQRIGEDALRKLQEAMGATR
jgi:RNA polymerase primary sigma factor